MHDYRFSVLIIVVGVFTFVSTAHSHAIVLSATPAPDEVLSGPDVQVKLRFNSRIDAKRSRLILVTPDGEQRTLIISSETSSPDALSSQAKSLRGGSYVLRWQVLASDGHITRGEVPFRVR